MSIIKLETIINAPIERVFDLSRSIDLHILSTQKTNEKAVAGTTSGLIGLGETVTWRAKHLGIYQHLTVKIVQFDRPHSFVDTMLKGAFAKMEHTHRFEALGAGTKMIDFFEFESPFGILGKWVNRFFLEDYLTKLLIARNQMIKEVAEGEGWRKLIL